MRDAIKKIYRRFKALDQLTDEAIETLQDGDLAELGSCSECDATGYNNNYWGGICQCVVDRIRELVVQRICEDADVNPQAEVERYRYETKRLNEQVRQMRKIIVSLQESLKIAQGKEVYPF
jgi:hypothetical protein